MGTGCDLIHCYIITAHSVYITFVGFFLSVFQALELLLFFLLDFQTSVLSCLVSILSSIHFVS